MSTDLRVEPSRVADLAERYVLPFIVNDVRSVVVSAAMYTDPFGSNLARYNAAIAAARSSFANGVPHIFMLDHQSHPEVETTLASAGGIVVPVDEGEGGLAKPYLTASMIVSLLCEEGELDENAIFIKVEGEKNIFGGTDTPGDYLDACYGRYDIATGVRNEATWGTMPYFQSFSEKPLGKAIGQVLGISSDTPSGVLVLGPRGRELFVRTTDHPKWPYLIKTPFVGLREGCSVGEFDIDMPYYPAVVAEENGNAVINRKRCQQVEEMFGYALDLASRHGIGVEDDFIRTMNEFQDGLAAFTSIVDSVPTAV